MTQSILCTEGKTKPVQDLNSTWHCMCKLTVTIAVCLRHDYSYVPKRAATNQTQNTTNKINHNHSNNPKRHQTVETENCFCSKKLIVICDTWKQLYCFCPSRYLCQFFQIALNIFLFSKTFLLSKTFSSVLLPWDTCARARVCVCGGGGGQKVYT